MAFTVLNVYNKIVAPLTGTMAGSEAQQATAGLGTSRQEKYIFFWHSPPKIHHGVVSEGRRT